MSAYRCFGIVLLTLSVFGCSPYSVKIISQPEVDMPIAFSQLPAGTSADAENKESFWWEEFEDEKLNELIIQSLGKNLTLAGAWARLKQAEAQARIVGSAQFPELTISGSAARNRLVDPQLRGAIEVEQTGTTYFNEFVARSGLSFELDVWQRVRSQTKAEWLRAKATRAEAENTALVLTGSIAELWFVAREQQALIELLESQISISETFLELTELRFAVGRGSALDVYQQRQLLAATRSELPVVRSLLEESLLRLAVLMGETPGQHSYSPTGTLPELPPVPSHITPALLLELRPDLRAARERLQGAEYGVASAVADRFPRLSVGLTYGFSASEISELFDRERSNVIGDLLLPLIDGGRRRARVALEEARVKELEADYLRLYLEALQEVETSLVQERFQVELIERLEIQERLAQATLRESRSRYQNGLTDYLDVIVAIQALQGLERRLISEQSRLLITRARLYRSLGGRWLEDISSEGLAPKEITA